MGKLLGERWGWLPDGRRRELYGIGERCRAFRGDERAIRRALREDGRGLTRVYFRLILTVDNPAAERFKRPDGHLSARVLREAIDKTFCGTLREAQGVFAIHEHGGADRPAHEHVHARQLVRPLPVRPRDPDDRLPFQLLPSRPGTRRTSQLELFTRAERAVCLVRASPWTARGLRLGRRGSLWARDPEKAARRATFRLASRVSPRSIA